MFILVVTNDLYTSDSIKTNLLNKNHHLVFSSNLQEVQTALLNFQPDLLILDYDLSEKNGLEIIEELQKKSYRIPPFIMVANKGDENQAFESVKLGAKDYLIKDVNLWEIFPNIIERIENEILNEKKILNAEKVILKQAQFEKLITSISSSFINIKIGEVDQNINSALKQIGEFLNLDRCVFGKLVDNGMYVEIRNVWNPGEIKGYNERYNKFDYPIFLSPIETGRTFVFERANIESIDFTTKEKEFFTLTKIQFAAVIPIEVDGKIDGCLAFSSVKEEFRLTEEILDRIKILSSIFGNLIARTIIEDDLRSSREKFKSLYDNAPLAYQSLDENGNFLDVNDHWLNTLGYSKDEVIGKSFSTFWPDDLRELFPRRFQELKDCGCKNNLHLKLKHKSGRILDVSFEAQVGYNSDGSFRQTYCVFKDVTKEKEVEEKLIASEARFDFAMAAANDGLFDWNLEDNTIYYSPQWKKMLGYNDEELPNDFSVWEKLTHPDDVKKSWDMHNDLILGKIDRFEKVFKMKHKDGHWVEILSRANAQFDNEGKAIRMVGTHVDVSQSKKTERTLKVLVEATSGIFGIEFFKKIVLSLSYSLEVDYVLIGESREQSDNRINTIALSSAGEIIPNIEYELSGTPCENVLGKTVCAYEENVKNIFPEDRLLIEMNIEGYVGVPLFNSKGNVLGLMAVLSKKKIANPRFCETILQLVSLRVSSEIERRRIDSELLESRLLLKESQRLSRIGGWQWTPKENKMMWTDEIYTIFGIEQNSIEPSFLELDKLIGNCIRVEDKKRMREAFASCLNDGREYDHNYLITTFDARKIWIRTTAKPIKENGEVVKIIGNIMDITELKTMQKQIDKFFDQPMNLHLIATGDGKMKRINEGWNSTLGYTKSDLKGKLFLDLVHPDDIAATLDEMKKLAKGEKTLYFENRYKHQNGSYRTMAWSAITDPEDQVIHAIAHDITERKKLDLINQTRIHLLQYSVEHNLDELLEETINQAEILTESKIGFYHFVEEDQKSVTLQNWSTSTKNDFCKLDAKSRHYEIEKAGVWADCVREGKPVIHNSYNTLRHKQGLPEGHTEVIRELVVPVKRGDKITAILGVGNKLSEYDENDISVVNLLADLAWEITDRKKAEEELKVLNHAIEQSPISAVITDTEGNIEYANQYFYELTGYSKKDALGQNPRILNAGTQSGDFYKNMWETIKSGETWRGEFHNKKKNGELYWENAIISPIFDHNSKILHFLAVKEDITDQKKSQAQLIDKMEKLERFNKVMVDRELKMIELKNEINTLLEELGREKKYSTK